MPIASKHLAQLAALPCAGLVREATGLACALLCGCSGAPANDGEHGDEAAASSSGTGAAMETSGGPADASDDGDSTDASSATSGAAETTGADTQGEPGLLGTVIDVQDLASCPNGAPVGATCKQVTVVDCPGIESESIDATLAILPANGTAIGTITHFKGGGGEGFLTMGATDFQTAGFRQVWVSWSSDWELTASRGIKTAGCRPSTLIQWIFEEPTLHAASRTTAFCGEGKSGGSAQLGYALAHYGLGDVLDYVTERAGPPFARIDLGCDGSAPPTAIVCGDTVKMQLPTDELDAWENIVEPLHCGDTDIPADELERWKNDSIAVGGVYDYPQTHVEFFDCTYNAPAVTGMSQLYYDQIVQAEGDTSRVGYNCYGQADDCSGEGLGPRGEQEAIDSMIANCLPRHR